MGDRGQITLPSKSGLGIYSISTKIIDKHRWPSGNDNFRFKAGSAGLAQLGERSTEANAAEMLRSSGITPFRERV